MTGRLTRCSQGHVFAVTDVAVCPVCGEELLSQEQFSKPQPNPRIPSSALIWCGSAAIAVVIGLTFAFWPKSAALKEDPPPAQSAPETAKPEQGSANASPLPKGAPSNSTEAALPLAPFSKSAAQNPPKDTTEATPSSSAQSPALVAPSPKTAPQPLPEVTPQLPKSTFVQPAATQLPTVDYPGDAVAKLQSTLGLSAFLIDMLGEFAAADAMSTAPTPEAVAVMTKLSEKGLPVAQFDLANIYYTGQVVGQDDGQALRYLREAADAGVGPARMKFAQILEEGRLALQDRRTARELVTLATREGISGASVVARQMGIDPSTLGPTGPELTDMALQGNEKTIPIANAFISDRLASGYIALAWYGAKFSKDPNLRRDVPEFARNAVGLGVSNGMNVLANLYRDDVLVGRNDTEAYLWITLAHRFCNRPEWCAAEEKLIAKLAKKVDMMQVDALKSAISQIVSPPSDITK